MTERPNVPVLKTGVGLPTVGSNPTPSAKRARPHYDLLQMVKRHVLSPSRTFAVAQFNPTDSVIKTKPLRNRGDVHVGTRNVPDQLKRFIIGEMRR